MSIHFQAASYSSAAEMQDAHRARQQRFAEAARKAAAAQRYASMRLPAPRWVPPAPKCELPKDAHVKAWQRWQADQVSICRNYLLRRCEELGFTHEDIIRGGRKTGVVQARDKIIYEIKRHVKPSISWAVLGKLVNRDHSSTIVAFYRGAVAAGEQEYAGRVMTRRVNSRNRHRAKVLAKGKAG